MWPELATIKSLEYADRGARGAGASKRISMMFGKEQHVPSRRLLSADRKAYDEPAGTAAPSAVRAGRGEPRDAATRSQWHGRAPARHLRMVARTLPRNPVQRQRG